MSDGDSGMWKVRIHKIQKQKQYKHNNTKERNVEGEKNYTLALEARWWRCVSREMIPQLDVDFLDAIDCICFAFLHYEPISLVLEASGGGGDYGDDVDAGDGDTGGDTGGDGGGDGDDVDPENQQMVIPLMAIRLTMAALVIILQMNC